MRNKAVRDTLIRGLGQFNLHAVKRVNKTDLAGLIETLHPIDSGIELIRLGPDGDGGYLIPDDLEGIRYGFSPGVSTESGFEADLADRGMNLFLADYSVEAPAQSGPALVFDKKFIGCISDDTYLTLDDWKEARLPEYNDDLLLQMDIEGAEYESLMAVSMGLLAQFRIMVIEFHYMHQLWNKPWFALVSRVFDKISKTHSVVHIHPNNCCGALSSRGLVLPRVAEFTFLRNDRVKQRNYRASFPHPLDRDNTAKDTLPLPRCWYRV